MPYSQLLKKLAKEKRLTYKEIADKCNHLGENLTSGYIKDCANNKKKPPSEKKNRAIAKALGINEEILVLEGYIDKAPKEIKELLNKIREYSCLVGLSSIQNKITKDQYEFIKYELSKQSMSEFLVNLIEKYDLNYIDNKNFSITQENISFSIKYDNISFLDVIDDSMKPQIDKNSKVMIEIKEKYLNGEILALKVKGINDILYRIVVFNNSTIILTPLNKNYRTITYNKEDIEILGKVAKVIKEL